MINYNRISILSQFLILTCCCWPYFIVSAGGSGDIDICDSNNGNNKIFCNCVHNNKDNDDASCYVINNISPEDPFWSSFNSRFNALKISGYNGVHLKFFPKSIFINTRDSLTDIIFSDHKMHTLPSYSFKDMSQLKSIEFALCLLEYISNNVFVNLPKLEKIIFISNNFSTLPNMFNSVPSLKELFLEDNQIVTIAPNAFINLNNLTYLSLDRNRIRSIKSSDFVGLDNLKVFEIRENRIKTLGSQLFQNMPNVETLDLSSNQIESISMDTFINMKKLQEISLENNRLNHIGTHFFTVENLVKVNLMNNRLQALSKISFQRPTQKRYVLMKIGNNTLYCNCNLMWLKDAFETYDILNHNELTSNFCYKGSNKFSNETLFHYLWNKENLLQCSQPTAQEIFEEKDGITVAINTVDSISDTDNIEINENKHDIELDDRKFFSKSPMDDNVEKNFKTLLENEQKHQQKIHYNEEKDVYDGDNEDRLNRAGFNSNPTENGANTIQLLNFILLLNIFITIFHCMLPRIFLQL